MAVVLTLALIGAFGSGGSLIEDSSHELRNPGQIMDMHAGATGKAGCGACHESHDKPADQFVLAAFQPSGPSNSMTNKCLDCHSFKRSAGDPHKQTNCTTCHTEHKGAVAPVSTLTDRQCHNCHKKKFSGFSKSHPKFGKTYPFTRRTAIAFDHVKHLGTHFKDPRFAKLAPKGRCVGCHEASKASTNVPIKGFDENCAGCHEEQIQKKDLVVFTLPEFEKNPLSPELVKEACAKVELEAEDEYESVSTETLNSVMSALLDVEEDDIQKYSKPVGALLANLLKSGTNALDDLVENAEGLPAEVMGGISPVLLRSAVCSWAANQEFEDGGAGPHGGWYADEFSLRYKAINHGDKTMVAWMNFAASAELDGLTEAVLDPKGPGACVKCHSVSETDMVRVEWKSVLKETGAHHRYSHAPHLDLLGPGSQCETCHKLNATAKFAAAFKQFDPKVFNSNFLNTEQQVCATCHREGQVAQGCLVCHNFHDNAGFKGRMMVGKLMSRSAKK